MNDEERNQHYQLVEENKRLREALELATRVVGDVLADLKKIPVPHRPPQGGE